MSDPWPAKGACAYTLFTARPGIGVNTRRKSQRDFKEMASCAGLCDVVTLVGAPLNLDECRKQLGGSVLHLADTRRRIPRLDNSESEGEASAGAASPPPPPISRRPVVVEGLMRSRASFSSLKTSSSARTHRAAHPYARPSSRVSRTGSDTSDSSGPARLAELDSMECVDQASQFRYHPGPRFEHMTVLNC